MKQLLEATPISKKKIDDLTSENFTVEIRFPQVLTFCKFELLKLFTFSHTCSKIFTIFFRQRKHTEQRKHNQQYRSRSCQKRLRRIHSLQMSEMFEVLTLQH